MHYTDGTTEQLSKSNLTPMLSKEPAVGVAAQASVMPEEMFAAVATSAGAVRAAAASEEEATAAAATTEEEALPGDGTMITVEHMWRYLLNSVKM